MDPITLGMAAIGIGMQIFGGMGQSKVSEQEAAVSKDEAAREQAINDQKQQAMEIDARRKSLEQMRTAQKANSMALSAATNQNAQFGSGLQGGQAEVTDQSLFNLSGINTSLTIGRNINEQNKGISQDKMQMASLGADSASYAGWGSLGGALVKAGPVVGQFSKGFGSLNLGSGMMGGGSPSGYGTG